MAKYRILTDGKRCRVQRRTLFFWHSLTSHGQALGNIMAWNYTARAEAEHAISVFMSEDEKWKVVK